MAVALSEKVAPWQPSQESHKVEALPEKVASLQVLSSVIWSHKAAALPEKAAPSHASSAVHEVGAQPEKVALAQAWAVVQKKAVETAR